MNNYRVVVLLIIIFVLAIAGAFYIYRRQTANVKITDFEPLPSPGFTFSSPSPSPVSATQVPGQQPAAGSDSIVVKNEGIKVITPSASSQITSPVTIAGYANVLSGKVQIKIKDGNGKILGSTQTTACFGYDACTFETTINFDSPTTQAGILEVYSPSSLDNSAKYLQQILIRF